MNTKEPKPRTETSTETPGLGTVLLGTELLGTELLGTPGPFQVCEDKSYEEHANSSEAPKRKYDCTNYDACLDLAAALNWDSFTCVGCNQELNSNLVWRAHQAKRHDAVAHSICSHLPEIGVHSSQTEASISQTPVSPKKQENPATEKSKLA